MGKRDTPQDDQFGVEREWWYTEVENDVLEDDTLDNYDKLTYVMLCKFANHKSGECFPSYSTLMKLVGCGRKRLAKSLDDLEERGWIVRKNRQKEEGTSNLYSLPGKKRFDTSILELLASILQAEPSILGKLGSSPEKLASILGKLPLVSQGNTNYINTNYNHLTNNVKNLKRKTESKPDKFKDFQL